MHKAVWAGGAVAALAGAGALWWFLGGDTSPTDTAPPAAQGQGPAQALARAAPPPLPLGQGRTTPGAAGNDPLLTPGLRDAIEAMLHDAGEAGSPDALKLRLEALVGQHFAPELTTRALALARRYVDYRVALGQLRPPADPLDPHAMRQALEQRQKLRLQHFDGDEYEALFGQQQLLDQALLARLEIERNTALSAEEKRKALAETEAQLPAPLRAQRSESVAHVGAAQQTAAFNAQGADDATRFAQRSATYGAEAAERLARLDREERDWNARLDQYQQARSAGQDAARLDQLRQTLFTPEEQLRLEGALGLRSPAQNR